MKGKDFCARVEALSRARLRRPYSGFQCRATSGKRRVMVPYPQELRTRVVAAVEQGEMTIGEVARVFSVGVTFVKKMLRLHRAGEQQFWASEKVEEPRGIKVGSYCA